MAKVGIIGGSGLYDIEGFENVKEEEFFDTPFGQPSDKFVTGTFKGVDVIFLARHGRGHKLSPTEVNYRANIFAISGEIGSAKATCATRPLPKKVDCRPLLVLSTN